MHQNSHSLSQSASAKRTESTASFFLVVVDIAACASLSLPRPCRRHVRASQHNRLQRRKDAQRSPMFEFLRFTWSCTCTDVRREARCSHVLPQIGKSTCLVGQKAAAVSSVSLSSQMFARFCSLSHGRGKETPNVRVREKRHTADGGSAEEKSLCQAIAVQAEQPEGKRDSLSFRLDGDKS